MNMVSVQGTGARSFFMEGDQLLMFHSMLHSVLDHQYLLISSKFKTDLLYTSPDNLNNFFIQKFLLTISHNPDETLINRFYCSATPKDTLEAYFIRLYQFQKRKDWFQLYSGSIKKEFENNGNNAIVKHLRGCCEKINLNAFDNFNQVKQTPAQHTIATRQEAYFRLMAHIEELNYN